MTDLLQRLARRERIAPRVVIVAAHPDDEILALGSRLRLVDDLCILYLTDGAPRDPADARRAGCVDRAGYAALRRDELQAALATVTADAELRGYGCPDQDAVLDCAAIVDRLATDLAGAAAVVTHAYEHGHPDHDTAALAVALACERLGRDAPRRFEFPGYHIRGGRAVFGTFWPDPRAPETVLPLTPRMREVKRAALECFSSQAETLALFPLDERLRAAPSYDFAAPAPPREAWYDRLGWRMTLRVWRTHAGAVLGSPPACA